MPRGAEGPAELALRPLVLRRLPRRMAVALRREGGNEEEVSHLQGQDPPVEGNGVLATFKPCPKEKIGRQRRNILRALLWLMPKTSRELKKM
ncbi:hypothetical protein THAOC_34033 [Thalassiosira oceanica]|uniref:Uncharacterized protein n=1 Tax=Thalassiosira oceanica TaxID=159749 RepID=K0R367_THAOC|nr:hypothetical protein THAOC_34033 [Thalassiosira oceanica]|eukprot:EJK47263.1 hypothetical protein THAOC_34033 [Thalassiosira oceanica]